MVRTTQGWRGGRVRGSSGIFRYNWLLLFLVWALLSVPACVAFYAPDLIVRLIIVNYVFFFGAWAAVVLRAAFGLKNLRPRVSVHDEKLLRHLVAVSLFNEPLQLIEETLNTLAAQTIASRLAIVVGFESKTADLNNKIEDLRNHYELLFRNFIFTVHLDSVPGEVQGKCSNVNYSLRQAVARLGLDPNGHVATIVTTCDADNLFHPRHFEELECAFLKEEYPHFCVWQAPLFYDWKLARSSLLARITGVMRSIHMLGVLIPLQINVMSVQSLSLKLLTEGEFVHPGYQMDDILNVPRWMTILGRRVRIRILNVPVISGPTSGIGIMDECNEWRLQVRRWAIGTAEVFHYFIAHAAGVPARYALPWLTTFIGYYYFYQITGPILLLAGGLYTAFYPSACKIAGFQFSTWTKFAIGTQLLLTLSMHGLQIFWTRYLGIGHSTDWRSKIIDIIFTPLVVFLYSIVSLLALHELAIRGKKICTHEPSQKIGLR